MGSKKNPMWRVVVADQRSPRDGRIIESIGHYNPQTQPSTIVIDRERLQHWIELGAQPTNTVRKLMRAPDTVAPAVKQEAVAAEPAAPVEPEAESDVPATEASTEDGEAGTVPTPEAEGNAEPPAEGDAAPDGTAGSESDAGPSGAAVEPLDDDAPAAEEQPPSDAEPGTDS